MDLDLLVLLHGFGDDPARLAALVPGLLLPPSVEVLVPVGRHDGGTGPAWVPSEPTAEELAAGLDELTATITSAGAPPRSAVVGGFSQGGAMALALGLRAGPDRWHPRAVFGL